MSTVEEYEQDTAIEAEDAPPDVPHGGSVLDHVRARRDELAQEGASELILEVPGTAMGVRCRYPEAGADAIVRAFEQAQSRTKQAENVAAAARLLALCCAEVVGRLPDQEWQPLDPADDRPLRFSTRLADLLGIDVPADGAKPAVITRQIVRHVFSPKAQATGVYEGDIALLDKAGELAEWLRTGLRNATEGLEGE